MKKSIIYAKALVIICMVISNTAFSQNPPYISSIDKTSASANSTLTIIGIDFPTNAANLSVKFGAAEATVISTSATLIEVTVPANATFDNITVTDTSTGLTAYSNEAFGISHGGNAFSVGDLDPFETQTTNFNKTQDICICDFDGDGKNDIVTTNDESNSINIFVNNSTTAAINLTNTNIDLGIESINATCGDLNGDGKPDLIVTRGGSASDRFFILTNTSPSAGTVSFDPDRLAITLPSQIPSGDVRSPKRPIVQDMDLDGKPDIVLTNTADNEIFIYKNNSSAGTISLESSPAQVTIPGINSSLGLDVKDLNNDGFPEPILVIVPNTGDPSGISILPNNSQPGSILIGEPIIINVSSTLRNLKSGDLNGDGLNDIAATSNSGGVIFIFENNTTGIGGDISFQTAIPISNTTSVWGIDMLDIEGDGDLDIVSPSLTNGMYFLLNDNPNDLSTFRVENVVLGTPALPALNIKAGDINGDGKPDLAFIYNGRGGFTGQLGIITNRNCVVPAITPSANRAICVGTTLRLEATGALDATYDWRLDNVSVKNGSDNFIDITGASPGSYTVVMSDGLACGETSNAVVISTGTNPDVTSTAASDTGGTPVCVGTTVTLSTNTVSGATYSWTGPNGYVSDQQNPNFDAASTSAGTYTVTAEAGGCISNPSSTVVLVETVPVISVNNSNQDVFCTGSSVQINVPAQAGSFTYSWKKDDTLIDGQDNTTLTVTEGGQYKATITSTNGCFFESTARTITEVGVPVPSFDRSDAGGILTGSNSSICRDLVVNFTATSSDQGSGFTILNSWDFGDTNTSTDNITANTYTAAGDFTVTLTATYPDIDNCSTTEQVTQNLTITDIPTVDITTEGGTNEKCPSGTLGLSIPDTYTNYLWSSGETVSNITVLDPDVYSVSATDQFGCNFTTPDVTISNFASSGIFITTNSASNIDEPTRSISVEDGQLVVELTVNNVVGDVAWTPSSVIADTTLTTVEVSVQEINTLVTVFGDDAEGCMESDTVRILNNNIRAKKVFSPNGDGIGDDCWEITNSRSDSGFSGCTIFIFDSKGRTIQQLNGPFPDDCVWEGNINGSPAPEGVYYYALKCSDNNLSLSGSILLAR